MSSLFQIGSFTLASGRESIWKMDCDALVWEDWLALAEIAAGVLPPFGAVEGVPRGGLLFAEALCNHVNPFSDSLLIAEDVVTTGGSMERWRAGRPALGVAVLARGTPPRWVTPLLFANPILSTLRV